MVDFRNWRVIDVRQFHSSQCTNVTVLVVYSADRNPTRSSLGRPTMSEPEIGVDDDNEG